MKARGSCSPGHLFRGMPTERQYGPPDRSPGQLPEPKEYLLELLAEAQVPYTEAVAIRIAELLSLRRVEELCPSFISSNVQRSIADTGW
jgi:hypothetical protein